MNKDQVLGALKHQLLVACQAYPPSPHASVEDMVKMAMAGKMGGCNGFRVNHPEYIKAIRSAVGEDCLIIGVWKIVEPDNDVYMTTTMEAVEAIVTAGSDIVAIDCSQRVNAYGYRGYELVKWIKAKYPELVVMGDCSNLEDAIMAEKAGVDIVSTTLSGYTPYTSHLTHRGVDLQLIRMMKEQCHCMVLAEGKIWTREDAVAAFAAGADAIVVGAAITNPWMITERFISATQQYFNQ